MLLFIRAEVNAFIYRYKVIANDSGNLCTVPVGPTECVLSAPKINLVIYKTNMHVFLRIVAFQDKNVAISEGTTHEFLPQMHFFRSQLRLLII